MDCGGPDLVDLPVLRHRGAQFVLVDVVGLGLQPGREGVLGERLVRAGLARENVSELRAVEPGQHRLGQQVFDRLRDHGQPSAAAVIGVLDTDIPAHPGLRSSGLSPLLYLPCSPNSKGAPARVRRSLVWSS